MVADSGEEGGITPTQLPTESASSASGSSPSKGANFGGRSRPTAIAMRGPSVHRYNVGTWGTYHAARLVARSLAGATRGTSDQE